MADFSRNGNNGDNQQKRYEKNLISNYRFSDPEQGLSMTLKYWSGLFCIQIDSVNRNSGQSTYEMINQAFFSPQKALITADILDEFLANPKNPDVGVSLGFGDVVTCVTFGYNKDGVIHIDICKVNPDGSKDKEVRFNFSKDYYYSLNYSDYAKMKCDKVFHNNIEIHIIKNALREFANAMTGSYAYATLYYGRFDYSRINTKIDLVMDKLGIPKLSGNSGSSFVGSNNNFFNRNGAASSSPAPNTSSSHREIEDLDSLMDDD